MTIMPEVLAVEVAMALMMLGYAVVVKPMGDGLAAVTAVEMGGGDGE